MRTKPQNQTNKSKKSPFDPTCPVTLCFPDRLLFSITSAHAGRTSDIYIEDSSRTAIILPSLDELRKKPKNKILNDQVTAGQEMGDEDPARPSGAASEILELTRGIISENDAIAFLELGCHTDEILDALKARTKWKLSGLETSPFAVKEAISRGYQIFEATLTEASGLSGITQSFDVIYLRDGIERFDEPLVILRRAALLLNPDGLLIVRTPNLDSEHLKQLGAGWEHWKPEKHRFIYSKKSLKTLLALSGFNSIKLWTVSDPGSGAGRTKLVRNGGAPAPTSGEDLDLQSKPQTEGVPRSSELLLDRFGKGDVISAIFRRIY